MIHYLSEIKEDITEQQIIIYKQSVVKKNIIIPNFCYSGRGFIVLWNYLRVRVDNVIGTDYDIDIEWLI